MRDSGLTTLIWALFSLISYFISPSLSAGLLLGVFSFFLIRLFILANIKAGKNGFIILFLNTLKFGVLVLLVYVLIKWLKMDAIMITIGYSIAFVTTITEIFIRRPKEL